MTIEFGAPTISSVSPPMGMSGAGDQLLTITGTHMAPQTTVNAAGSTLATTFNSDTQITATLPAGQLATVGTISIDISNPAPGGGTDSSSFTVFDSGAVTATNHPQVARYAISPPVDAQVAVEFGIDTTYGRSTWALPTPGGGGPVDILVAGMRGFTDYNMRAVVTLSTGDVIRGQNKTFTTGGLDPAKVPTMTITQSPTLTPTPGVEVLDVFRGAAGPRGLVTELDGEIIWWFESPNMTLPLGFLADGTFAAIEVDPATSARGIRIVNLAGETVNFVDAPTINQKLIAMGWEPVSGTLHHDIRLLPNGNLLLLTDYTKDFTDLPGFTGQTISVLGDGLVVLDQNLDPVWVWSAFDHLDVNRHPMQFPNARGVYDWTHANALIYSPGDGNLIMSMRHQHWVIKIDFQDGMGTGNVLWRHGSDGDFAIVGGDDAEWQYGQHYPSLLDTSIGIFRLMAYDNGNQRPTDPAGTFCEDDPIVDCFSRSVIFEVDELLQSSRVLWEDNLPFYSSFIGSSELLGDDRIHFDSGGVGGPGTNPIIADIREVTMEPSPQIVWQMILEGQNVYRAVRLPSLYPGVQW